LPSFVEAAVVRGLGNPGPIIAMSLPAEVAAERTTLRLPAEASAVCEHGAFGPATVLPLPAEAAAVREHGDFGTATILPPPIKTAVATHAHGVAKNLLRAEVAPFN
jgi:hypothetical protein